MNIQQATRKAIQLATITDSKIVDQFQVVIGGKVIQYYRFEETDLWKKHCSDPTDFRAFIKTKMKSFNLTFGTNNTFFTEVEVSPEEHPFNTKEMPYVQYTNMPVSPKNLRDLEKDCIICNPEGIYFCFDGDPMFSDYLGQKKIGCFAEASSAEYIQYLQETGKIIPQQEYCKQ